MYRQEGSNTWVSVFTSDLINDGNGTYSAVVSLAPSTTYRFKAVMSVLIDGVYQTKEGAEISFTTLSEQQVDYGYLANYEVPAIPNLSGTGTNGTVSDRDDLWYRYNTTNSQQKVAVHTFTHPYTNKRTRNYTVLYDRSKYAPLWVAYAMHSYTWKKILSGQTGGWIDDPAINLTQQSGLDNASTVGYSKGHMVSSNERQTTSEQNAQTFYNSNMAPQWQNGFNSGVWSTLEQKIVDNSPSGSDTLYVVTGVLYDSDWNTTNDKPTTLRCGNLNVPIPSHFYKCLMKCSFDSYGIMTAAIGIAYLFTNESHTGAHYYDSNFVTTIDEIETLTGFEFFPNVPSNLQSQAEGTATPLWTN